MVSLVLFTVSGAAIVTLTIAKRVEERHGKCFFVLKAISKGDERIRQLHHIALERYSLGKEQAAFLIKKQLPLRAKSLWNKSLSYLHEQIVCYLGDMRNSRLLKHPDGISEFFKSISEVEKGNGEINETYSEPEASPIVNTVVIEEAEDVEEAQEVIPPAPEIIYKEPVAIKLDTKTPAKRTRKPRTQSKKARGKVYLIQPLPEAVVAKVPAKSPRKRKLKVLELD